MEFLTEEITSKKDWTNPNLFNFAPKGW
jgi:hypothetical protein